jgi:1-deoxy-D-xylulose-5-phosphate synthase
MAEILPTIDSPQDIKQLGVPELAQLAKELREFIVATVSNTGGHLAPSLGAVELTLALHHVYDTPRDKIIWDVGHQAYVHKIITGRRDLFCTIRQHGGISGFPKIDESPYDAFGVGHASTAISAALGMACARDHQGEDYAVVAIVGDGALTGGLSYEGLNNTGALGRNMVVVLNDNAMSISRNVGAISKYLTNLITTPAYNRLKTDIWNLTGKLSFVGSRIRGVARRLEEGLKAVLVPGMLFESLGFRYFGPIDGHNIAGLLHIFHEIRKLEGPILLHILTQKGKGFLPAEKNASVFHGLGKFDPSTGEVRKTTVDDVPTYSQVFGNTIVDIAKRKPNIVVISAAMALGTGLSKFAEEYPERFYDVGIAEAHAVTFAAGLASRGMRPVVAIYSTFLQRSYDQIIHDVALQKLPVVFVLDRAGIVGDDGPTHHGMFDLSYLRHIPGIVIMAPKDEEELRHMLWTALEYKEGPVAIRYPRGRAVGTKLSTDYQCLHVGISEVLIKGKDTAILAIGSMVSVALDAAKLLQEEDGIIAEVINVRYAKPIDTEMLQRVLTNFTLVVTVEENVLKGGFGSEVAEYCVDRGFPNSQIIRLGIPDYFIEHGDKQKLCGAIGLNAQGIVDRIHDVLRNQSIRNNLSFKNLVPIHS